MTSNTSELIDAMLDVRTQEVLALRALLDEAQQRVAHLLQDLDRVRVPEDVDGLIPQVEAIYNLVRTRHGK